MRKSEWYPNLVGMVVTYTNEKKQTIIWYGHLVMANNKLSLLMLHIWLVYTVVNCHGE